MLVSGTDPAACLVDFGACVPFGQRLDERTDLYSFDVTLAHPKTDITCLATTLLDICGYGFLIAKTLRDTEKLVEGTPAMNSPLREFILRCLNYADPTIMRQAVNEFVEA